MWAVNGRRLRCPPSGCATLARHPAATTAGPMVGPARRQAGPWMLRSSRGLTVWWPWRRWSLASAVPFLTPPVRWPRIGGRGDLLRVHSRQPSSRHALHRRDERPRSSRPRAPARPRRWLHEAPWGRMPGLFRGDGERRRGDPAREAPEGVAARLEGGAHRGAQSGVDRGSTSTRACSVDGVATVAASASHAVCHPAATTAGPTVGPDAWAQT